MSISDSLTPRQLEFVRCLVAFDSPSLSVEEYLSRRLLSLLASDSCDDDLLSQMGEYIVGFRPSEWEGVFPESALSGVSSVAN